MPSYNAAIRTIGNAARHVCTGRRVNNRAENSHQLLRRRERAMLQLRRMGTLQKFATVQGTIYNHFDQQRHLSSRQTNKANRSAAMAACTATAGCGTDG